MTENADPTASSFAGAPGRGAGRKPASSSVLKEYLGMAAVLGLLVIIFSLCSDRFLSLDSLRTVASQIPAAVLVATGMTFVLIIAEIDLSVGSVLALSGGVLGVYIVEFDWPVWGAIGAALIVGALCGLFSGAVMVRWRLPSFIVTLGMLEMARGGTHYLTQSQTAYVGSRIEAISQVSILGFSLPFLLAVAVVIVGQLVLSRTVFGRYLIAIGTNAEAVRLSGINPHPYRMAVFVLSGFLVGVAAVINTSRMASADPNAGTGFELQAIAAVVIGGTSLMGGRGSVVSSFFGVLIIAVLEFGLAVLGTKEEVKRLITGAVIVLAVILDYYRHRLKRVS
jgi:ribose transport system permease protein